MIWAVALLASAQPQCAESTAVQTTVEQLAREPTKWFDRCVRLDGYLSGYTFFSGPRGYYRRFATDAEDHPNDGWLGLYFEEKGETGKPFSKVSLLGKVDSCERSYQAAVAAAEPNAIVMSMGYCHYQGGLVLKQVRVLARRKARLERQTGEAARIRFGDLERSAERHPVPTEARRVVNEFREAFAAADRNGLLSLVEPYDVEFSNRPEEKLRYASLLAGDWGPLTSWREQRQLPEPTWFYAREPITSVDAPHWFPCFCRESGCDGKWPIAGIDTGLSLELPYVCLRVYADYERGQDYKLGADVSAFWEAH